MYNLCVFEDTKYRQFLPLTQLRPVYDLACGLDTLLGKIVRLVPHENVILHSRDYLKDYIKQNHVNALINHFTSAGSCLFINGRCLINDVLLKHLDFEDGKNYLFLNEQQEVVMAYLYGDSLVKMNSFLARGPINIEEVYQTFRLDATSKKIDVVLANYPWDLINHHADQVEIDFSLINGGVLKGQINPNVCIINESKVFIDQESKVDAFSVIDASEGPVYIGQNVHIHAHSLLKGPIFLGDNSQCLGAKITRSYIGSSCKIGGEISSSIILGYTNKAHEGFLGNSYLGEWINLGAMTTNSNLKNNYQTVKVVIDSTLIDTRETFWGCIIGDHTKTGIGTLLNTGIVIGVANNLYGGSLFAQRKLPAFLWGEKDKLVEHKLNKAIETATAVMKRREIKATDALVNVMTAVFELSKNDRLHFLGDQIKPTIKQSL